MQSSGSGDSYRWGWPPGGPAGNAAELAAWAAGVAAVAGAAVVRCAPRDLAAVQQVLPQAALLEGGGVVQPGTLWFRP